MHAHIISFMLRKNIYTVILWIAHLKVMRDSEVLMLSGSDFFDTWGAACLNDCNP